MERRVKTSLISIGIVSALTLSKFGLYALSGSIAVLSEAWHSFTDIATSLLVLLSIWISSRKSRKSTEYPEKSKIPDAETIVAGVIALFLLFISGSIFYNIFTGEPVTVSHPLTTGLIFIGLSFGSYFLYRFQRSMGEKEKSTALKADSLHSRTDMVISLLTGFSLVIYSIGIDLDRVAGGIIATLIFGFSVELLVNVVHLYIRGERDYIHLHTAASILGALFSRSFYRNLGSFLEKRFSGAEKVISKSKKLMKKAGSILLLLGSAALLIFWLSTSVFTVQPSETGVVLRMGKLTDDGKTYTPGLHFKLPFPFETALTFDTSIVRSLAVDNQTKGAMVWSMDHGDTRMFLSGENTLLLPYTVLNYRVKDPVKFVFSHKNPEKLLLSVSTQVLTSLFAEKRDLELISRHWKEQAEKRIEKMLDPFKMGVEIVSLEVRDIHPPREIAFAFENVVAARQERELRLNEALGKRSINLHRASRDAYQKESEAESYRLSSLRKAEGEAESYRLRLEPFGKYRPVLKKWMDISAKEEALKGRRKIVVDPKTGISQELLYIENIMKKGKK